MNRYNAVSAVALLALIVLLPFYAARESTRLQRAQETQQRQQLADATGLYLEHCATCHGVNGDGVGVMPALSNEALSHADPEHLFDVIARAAHGTAMSAWHVSEGGILIDYQISSLVTLVRFGDWEGVGAQAAAQGLVAASPQPVTALKSDNALLAARNLVPFTLPGDKESIEPHQCAACHEEPVIHADRFGLDCARCHGLEAWKPALLTRHTFRLDHGDVGPVACETCHVSSYAENTCYGCHDHSPTEMTEFHVAEGIEEFEQCALCHPTGREGEAGQYMQEDTAAVDAPVAAIGNENPVPVYEYVP